MVSLRERRALARQVRACRPRLGQPLLIVPSLEPAYAAPIEARIPERASRHVGWGGGGFLLGIVFWHMVGFWSFLADTLPVRVQPAGVQMTAMVTHGVATAISAIAEPAFVVSPVTERKDALIVVPAVVNALQTGTPSDVRPVAVPQRQPRPNSGSGPDPRPTLDGDAGRGTGGIVLASASKATEARDNCIELYIDPSTRVTKRRPCALRPGHQPDNWAMYETTQRLNFASADLSLVK